jgi:hypothetical protein
MQSDGKHYFDLIQLHFEAFGAHCVVKTVKNLLIRLDFLDMTIEVTTNGFGVIFFSFLSSTTLDKVKQSN